LAPRVAVALLGAALVLAPSLAAASSGGLSFGQAVKIAKRASRAAKPPSSSYGYKPSYGPPAGARNPFAVPSSSSAYGGASKYGAAGASSSAAGAASGLAKYAPGRATKATSLAVPLAVGAAAGVGAGALASSAYRSGQSSCGDGGAMGACYASACAQARAQCPGARGDGPLVPVVCPDEAFAECWASGAGLTPGARLGESDEPNFLCEGAARPASAKDVVATCFSYDERATVGGASSLASKAPAAAVDESAMTADQLLSGGDPALQAPVSSGGAARGLGVTLAAMVGTAAFLAA
jgi:hypothetical protein